MVQRRLSFTSLASLALVFLSLTGRPASRAEDKAAKTNASGAPAAPVEGRQARVQKEAFRFDGKPFDYWRDYLRTELKPERRVEALGAIKAFAANGYAKEAAQAILDMARTYKDDPSDKDKEVFSKALSAFRDIGQAGQPLLVASLSDSNRQVRSLAAAVLACHVKSIPTGAVPGLIRVAIDGGEDDNWVAAPALAKVDGVERLLRKELRDEKKAKRFVTALVEVIDKEPVAGLAMLFASDYEKKDMAMVVYSAPAAAAFLLGEMGPAAREAVPSLLKCMDRDFGLNPAPVIAANTLGKVGAEPERVVPALVAALKKDNPALRTCAARSLARFGPRAKSAAPALRNSLEDKDEMVCLSAFLALDGIGEDSRKTAPVVIAVLKKSGRAARLEAYKSIQGEGDLPLDRFVPVLMRAFEEFHDERVEIAAALGHFGPRARAAAGPLTAALGDKDPKVQRAAAAALRKIKEGNK